MPGEKNGNRFIGKLVIAIIPLVLAGLIGLIAHVSVADDRYARKDDVAGMKATLEAVKGDVGEIKKYLMGQP